MYSQSKTCYFILIFEFKLSLQKKNKAKINETSTVSTKQQFLYFSFLIFNFFHYFRHNVALEFENRLVRRLDQMKLSINSNKLRIIKTMFFAFFTHFFLLYYSFIFFVVNNNDLRWKFLSLSLFKFSFLMFNNRKINQQQLLVVFSRYFWINLKSKFIVLVH